MQQSRMMGYRVRKYAENNHVSIIDLSKAIGCSEFKFKSFLNGRTFLSFKSLSIIAEKLNVDIATILNGTPMGYDEEVVHCMNKFNNPENREKILDIIDEYVDILELLS